LTTFRWCFWKFARDIEFEEDGDGDWETIGGDFPGVGADIGRDGGGAQAGGGARRAGTIEDSRGTKACGGGACQGVSGVRVQRRRESLHMDAEGTGGGAV